MSEQRTWSDPRIEAWGARLDRISDDIKSLEAYLQAKAPHIAVEVAIPGGAGVTLAWMLGDPDKWRIICMVGSARRPLIETPAGTRMLAHAYLLRAVGDTVGQPTK